MLRKLTPIAFIFVLAAESAAQEVNIYSDRQPELIDPLLQAFTEETGIATNIVFLSKGMVERLKSEGRRSPADLAFTADIGRLNGLKQAGVLQAVDSAKLAANIPAQYRDPDNEWFALTTRARVVYASRTRVGDGDVTTYEDLANPKWRGRICTRSGNHPYMLALTAGMIEQHGEDFARDWLRDLRANLARKPQGNDRAQVKAIWAGQCDIAIGNTYYMALMLKDAEQMAWADAAQIVFPTFSGGGTHVNVSGMGITSAAPNRDNALKLMEFLASPRGQKLYAEVNNEYPVNSDIPALDIVAGFGDFVADDANLQDLANLRGAAARLTAEVDFDG